MSNKTIDLAAFDGTFQQEATEERGEFESLPDGKYQVVVEKVELTETQSTGNPVLKWTLRVLGPRFNNRLIWRNSVITNKTLRYLKTDLHLCGLDLDKLSDLPGRLKELLDVHLEVAKKTNGDYENIYFSRRITLSQGRSLSQAHEEANDSLLPF
jgi:hypothetical protein